MLRTSGGNALMYSTTFFAGILFIEVAMLVFDCLQVNKNSVWDDREIDRR